MWSLFEQGELKADSELTGRFARDETQADTEGVLAVIDDAREEAVLREPGRAGRELSSAGIRRRILRK
jgi:RIO kinase 1